MHTNAENAKYKVRYMIQNFNVRQYLLQALRQSALIAYNTYKMYNF